MKEIPEMVDSKPPITSQVVQIRVVFGAGTLPPVEYVKILGVKLDYELRFDRHLRDIAL